MFSPNLKITASQNEEGLPLIRPPRWADLFATACHVGHIKPGAGTWGAAIGVILWCIVEASVRGSSRTLVVVGVALVLTALGIRASTLVARATGIEDPSFVIVDEVIGQLVALIGVTITWEAAVAVFLLFRFFDITKSFPVRRLERLPEGAGIVMDDIEAGPYSLAVLNALLHFGILS